MLTIRTKLLYLVLKRPWAMFAVMGLIVTVITVSLTVYFNCKYEEHQERILRVYAERTEALSGIDGISCQGQGRFAVSPDSLDRLCRRIEGAAVDFDRADTDESIRHLLELEFNKIQHEYDVLAFWGGILTIVFLIFSFYSLFKGEEMNRQANEALRDLRRIKTEAEKKSTEIDTQIEGQTNKIIGPVKKQMEETKKSADELKSAVEGKNTEIEGFEERINAVKSYVDTAESGVDEFSNQKKGELKTYTDERIGEIERSLKAEFDKYKRQLEEIVARQANPDIQQDEMDDVDDEVEEEQDVEPEDTAE